MNAQIDKSIISKKMIIALNLLVKLKMKSSFLKALIKKNLSKELTKNIKKYLIKSNLNKIKKIEIIIFG